MSELLEKARLFEKENKSKVDSQRPKFHATGMAGWINDPNGFSTYKGEYHLFHQYHPYSLEWGPMHWGHLKSKDLIRWEWLPVALAPDGEYDCNGCFSGTAIELEDGRQMIMYTGVRQIPQEDGSIRDLQTQCVAWGDGVNYEKCESNPVIDGSHLPAGSNVHDFRDPKIWKEGDIFYALVANRGQDGSGVLTLFESRDAIQWKYDGNLAECHHEFGTMWECPDYFELNGKKVLLISPMEMEAVEHEFHNGHGVIAMIGTTDDQTHSFHREAVCAVDYGLDFYAPETLRSPDGRRIMIAWMRNWATKHVRKPETGYFGSMTLPRELEIRDGRLLQRPVKELDNYHGEKTTVSDAPLEGIGSFEGICGRVLDMMIEVEPTEEMYHSFRMVLGQKDGYGADIIYHRNRGIIEIDRTQCGGRFDVAHTRKFRVEDREGKLSLRIVMDRDSVELFVNDGAQAATFLMYSPEDADGIQFEVEGKAILNITKYEIVI